MTHARCGLALFITALISAPTALHAQGSGPERRPLTLGVAADALLSTAPGHRALPDLIGVGGRVTLQIGEYTSRGRDIFDHFTFGGFYSYFPERPPPSANTTGAPVSAVYYGVDLALHPLLSPAWGRFDPFLAIGAGLLGIRPRERNEEVFTVVSPGVGLQISVGPRIAMRLEGRYVVRTERGAATAAGDLEDLIQLVAGLSVGF